MSCPFILLLHELCTNEETVIYFSLLGTDIYEEIIHILYNGQQYRVHI